MKKHDLLKSDTGIIRVLDIQPDKILILDCIKRTMPVWVQPSEVDSYSTCSIEALNEATGYTVPSVDALDADQKRTMYERYTLIAPVLPFIADDKMRSRLIASMAEEHGVSKQTVRSHLCLYLAYLDIAALAPRKQQYEEEFTQDEKNIRWALNKFFYTTQKQSLSTAYTMMLKEKYCDSMGVLAETYPSFYQFRYFYRKTRNQRLLSKSQGWALRWSISLLTDLN